MNPTTDLPIPSAGAGPSRILVVDDEQTACNFCTLALSHVGYDVIGVTTVAEALETLRARPPVDLLLTDIQMPGMSGLELAQVAREHDPAIAIVIMTGHTSMDTMHQSVRRGVADFLSKPFEIEELRLAVGQALHKRDLMQESIRLRAFEQLLQSSEAISAILDRQQLGRVILSRARGHVPCAAGFLILAGSATVSGQVLAEPGGFRLLEAAQAAAIQVYREGRIMLLPSDAPLCADGDERIAGGLAVPLRAQGEIVGVLLLCDPGEGMHRQATLDTIALLANQAGTALRNAQLYADLGVAYHSLRELDRLKSEFIAIASHELRSPLSIVIGYSKMVRDRSAGEHREYAQRALDSAEQIRAIVDTMVHLNQADLKTARPSPTVAAIDELLAQAVERLAPSAEEKQQTIGIAGAPSGVRLAVDRELVLLMLGNLISNAIKFTPKGGRIDAEAAVWDHDRLLAAVSTAAPNPTLRQIAELPNGQWLVLRISDSGIGIAREQQPRIFERFYQVAGSLTRTQGGAGLGLALVCDLALLQRGLIWVESAPDQGSTFTLALPMP